MTSPQKAFFLIVITSFYFSLCTVMSMSSSINWDHLIAFFYIKNLSWEALTRQVCARLLSNANTKALRVLNEAKLTQPHKFKRSKHQTTIEDFEGGCWARIEVMKPLRPRPDDRWMGLSSRRRTNLNWIILYVEIRCFSWPPPAIQSHHKYLQVFSYPPKNRQGPCGHKPNPRGFLGLAAG